MHRLEIDHISLRFGGVYALQDFSMRVGAGELVAVIGPNGAGKTSLVNCISGVYRPEAGSVKFEGRDVTRLQPSARTRLGLARTFQNIALFKGMTVLDNVMTGRNLKMRCNFLQQAIWIGGARREELEHRRAAEQIIDFLEIQHVRKTPVGRLPYGLQKRVELARALALEPKLLLLDEPMAGMNAEEKEDMARFILDVNEEKGTSILMIEHDMGVVMDLSHRIIVLNFGKKIAEGLPKDVRGNREVQVAYLGADVA